MPKFIAEWGLDFSLQSCCLETTESGSTIEVVLMVKNCDDGVVPGTDLLLQVRNSDKEILCTTDEKGALVQVSFEVVESGDVVKITLTSDVQIPLQIYLDIALFVSGKLMKSSVFAITFVEQ